MDTAGFPAGSRLRGAKRDLLSARSDAGSKLLAPHLIRGALSALDDPHIDHAFNIANGL